MTCSRKNKTVFTLKVAALFVLSASSFSQNTHAARTSCAVKIREAVHALGADTQGVLISDEERSQIQKIFEDPQKSPFAAGYVFDLLMEKRLALLPSQDAEKIRKIIQAAKLKSTSGLNGWYSPRSRSVTISIPQSYHGTIVEFFIKTHEVEHAIQNLAAAGAIGKDSLNYFRRILAGFDAKLRFVEEAGAMQAEWQYLQALPTETKERMAREIRENTELLSGEKKFLSRVLSNDAWTAGDHLDSEWDAGRYTLSEMERITRAAKKTYVINAIGLASSSAAGILGAVYKVETFCEKALSESRLPPQGEFYQNVCLRFQNIREQQEILFPISQPSLPAKSHN